MINKKEFEEMRKELESFDDSRERLIKISRDVLKNSKGAIYSLHREDKKNAEAQLNSAKNVVNELNKLIKTNIRLADVGPYKDALEEYTEASLYYGFIVKKKIPSKKELDVDVDVYLSGLCDLVGELVRKAVNSAIKGNNKLAIEIKDFAIEIYEELMLFDFRNSPLRKKFDSIKYGVEKLEDLALKLTLK